MASVAVIGAGAVGSYYGARLAQAGHDVRFLLRRDYDAVAERGLRIESHHGDFALERPAIARDPAAIGPVDWVLCGLKTTALDDAATLIRPCLAPETRVLAIMNGLGIEERLAASLGTERVFGGLAFTCINRGDHLEFAELPPVLVDRDRRVGALVWIDADGDQRCLLCLVHAGHGEQPEFRDDQASIELRRVRARPAGRL